MRKVSFLLLTVDGEIWVDVLAIVETERAVGLEHESLHGGIDAEREGHLGSRPSSTDS